jgi:hypothetical protein
MLTRTGSDEEHFHARSVCACLAQAGSRHDPGMLEPGLDKHEWETEWQDLEEQLAEDPAMALSGVDDLIARMMEARGLPRQEREGETETEPETIREYLAAHQVMLAVENGEDVDPGDIGLATSSYRELYHALLGRGPA